MHFIQISETVIVNLDHVIDIWREGTSTLKLNVTADSSTETLNVDANYEQDFLNELKIETNI